MNIRKLSRPLLSLTTALLLTLPLLAAPAAASFAGSYSVRAILPENQVDTQQTYFDLRLSPGETQVIQVQVSNSEEEPILVTTGLNAAATGRNGLIVYDREDVRDESMKLSIGDIATVRTPTLEVAPGETALAEIQLTMPEEPVEGVVLGGLRFTAGYRDQEEEAEPAPGIALQNEYVYVIGLKVTGNDEAVEPDFELAAIEPGLVNYHTAVSIGLRNPRPLIVKGLDLSARIHREGESDPLRTLELPNAQMAPNSRGEFVVDWESAPLEDGDYRLRMTATYEGRVWDWDEAFTIGLREAQDVNSGAVGIPTRSYNPFLFAVIALLLVVAGVLIWLLARKSRKAQQ